MQEKAWERETAAFEGFCAGAAFALAWNGKLGTFSEFYSTDKAEPKKETTSQEYIDRYNSWS
jgi:hypothetical protein